MGDRDPTVFPRDIFNDAPGGVLLFSEVRYEFRCVTGHDFRIQINRVDDRLFAWVHQLPLAVGPARHYDLASQEIADAVEETLMLIMPGEMEAR